MLKFELSTRVITFIIFQIIICDRVDGKLFHQNHNRNDNKTFQNETSSFVTIIDEDYFMYRDGDSTTEFIIDETTETEPEDCIILITTTEISDENILTIKWTTDFNDPSICDSKTLNLSLTWLECDDETCKQEASVLITRFSYSFPQKLEACGNYEYEIIEIKWNGEESKIAQQIQANEEFEDIELKVFQDVESYFAVFLMWNRNENLLCEPNYKFELSSIETTRESYLKEVNVTIEGLDPCETYTITLYPAYKNNTLVESKGSSITYTMNQINPPPIRNLTVEYLENEKSLAVSYTPPVSGSKCVKTYEILVESDMEARNISTTLTREVFNLVYACTIYDITVFSTTFSDLETARETKNILIPTRIFNAPSPPRVADRSATSVNLTTTINPVNQKSTCKVESVTIRCIDYAQTLNITKEENVKMENDTSIELTGLEPFTDYYCYTKVKNVEVNIGDPTDPEQPLVKIVEVDATSCKFEWNSPKAYGIIVNYYVHIQFLNFSYVTSEKCENDFEPTTLTLSENVNEHVLINALPFSSYSVQVKAKNNENEGQYSIAQHCRTLAASPARVEQFMYERMQQELDMEYNRTTILKWTPPCRRNGKITKYIINAVHQFNPQISWTYEVDASQYIEEYSFNVENFQPDSQYNVSIQANTEEFIGRETFQTVILEAGLPLLTEWDSNEVIYSISTKDARLTIPYSIFHSEVGRITKILILVAEMSCDGDLTPEKGFVGKEPYLKSWREASSESCVPQYQTGTITDESIQTLTTEEGLEVFIFTVGNENCGDSPSYCNGPLKPGASYLITMRVFTRRGFSDTDYILIKTEKEVPFYTISISILSTMCVVFMIGFYITYKKTRTLREQSMDFSNDKKDIPINDFGKYFSEMSADDNARMKEEYAAIQAYAESLDKTFIASKANEKLNRYTNISPFDYNRVVLNDDEFENDYINASHINGYHYPREYIAAQGPKPNTAIDFWRMILQHKVESIVMLTSFVEEDRIKCHEYFPKLNGQITFSNINIICKSEENHQNFIKRIMEVEKDDEIHTVKHYYFTSWSDHGIPSSPSALIEFCKLFRSERQKLSGSIVVHCSAGVGRTGTFIALDIIMQRLKQEKKINIFELINQLRLQRMKMVQTLDQYVFLYNATKAIVNERTQRSQVLQNIVSYMNELKLFQGFKKDEKNKINSHQNESSL
ncbi:CLUMA_CG014018, isoform A [Clunio marinus]|uniref:protein-tyrosine-phosphatase n=1 Tax=Clunio marinus TaxID=568069 RepID=A0A1J1IKK8_9DIPT|nr:CLUMA_CG014018, isoform A [Clunio marinus]